VKYAKLQLAQAPLQSLACMLHFKTHAKHTSLHIEMVKKIWWQFAFAMKKRKSLNNTDMMDVSGREIGD